MILGGLSSAKMVSFLLGVNCTVCSPARIYLIKVNNRNTKPMWNLDSKDIRTTSTTFVWLILLHQWTEMRLQEYLCNKFVNFRINALFVFPRLFKMFHKNAWTFIGIGSSMILYEISWAQVELPLISFLVIFTACFVARAWFLSKRESNLVSNMKFMFSVNRSHDECD